MGVRDITVVDEAPPAKLAKADDSLKPGRYVDRYKVLFPLGKGGRGHVFVAYDPHLDRKVALKILRRRDPDGCAELVAEAKSIARLDHPNVVEVLAVGEHRGRLFMAMEFIEGCTLAQWLRRERRTWKEIVDAFVKAGRGLEAAHRTGLIHRDFKPQNVMVGRDGRIRVLDFGMAVDHSQSITSTESTSRSKRPGFSGTVAYMAPEQFMGDPLDGRTDQFAFCVSMFEALWGYAPFPGAEDSVRSHVKAVVDGRLRRPPRRGPIPASVRRAVLRGLRNDPLKRWPSMAHLLSELAKAGRPRRWPLYAAGSIGILASSAAVSRGESDECSAEAALGHELWGPERQQRVRDLLGMQGSAPFTAKRIITKIENSARSWKSHYQARCKSRAGALDGLSFDREMTCIRRRGQELDAFIAALASADRIDLIVTYENLAQLSFTPEALQECADVGSGPAKVAQSSPVTERFDQINAYLRTAQFERAYDVARATEAMLAKSDMRAEHPKAMFWLGMTQLHRGRFEQARERLEQAYWASSAIGDDHTAALSAVRTLGLLLAKLRNLPAAKHWSRHAEARLERVEASPKLHCELLERQALLAQQSGDANQAKRLYRAAMAELAAAGGRDSLRMARIHNNYGNLLESEGALAQALEHQQRALLLKRQHVGDAHPLLTTTMQNVAHLAARLGDFTRSQALLEQAISIRSKAYGEDHLAVAFVRTELGHLMVTRGQHTRARVLLESLLGQYERSNEFDTHWILVGLARCEIADGRLDVARMYLHRALDQLESDEGSSSRARLVTYRLLGDVAREQRVLTEAQIWYERGRSLLPSNQLHPDGVALNRAWAKLRLAEGDADAAAVFYRDALRTQIHHELDPLTTAELKLELAAALGRSGDAHDQVRALAEQVISAPETDTSRWPAIKRRARRLLAKADGRRACTGACGPPPATR